MSIQGQMLIELTLSKLWESQSCLSSSQVIVLKADYLNRDFVAIWFAVLCSWCVRHFVGLKNCSLGLSAPRRRFSLFLAPCCFSRWRCASLFIHHYARSRLGTIVNNLNNESLCSLHSMRLTSFFSVWRAKRWLQRSIKIKPGSWPRCWRRFW